jgi:hypothetical protein
VAPEVHCLKASNVFRVSGDCAVDYPSPGRQPDNFVKLGGLAWLTTGRKRGFDTRGQVSEASESQTERTRGNTVPPERRNGSVADP